MEDGGVGGGGGKDLGVSGDAEYIGQLLRFIEGLDVSQSQLEWLIPSHRLIQSPPSSSVGSRLWWRRPRVRREVLMPLYD